MAWRLRAARLGYLLIIFGSWMRIGNIIFAGGALAGRQGAAVPVPDPLPGYGCSRHFAFLKTFCTFNAWAACKLLNRERERLMLAIR